MTRLHRAAIVAVALGAAAVAWGAWIPAKAVVAQHLLRRAWAATGSSPVRPWPWARTWPVARLQAPSLGVDEIVLAGAEGAALAFAPGHVDGTAAPGEDGNVVLAGHRDTVFQFLGELRPGDRVWLETANDRRIEYVVDSGEVIDERDVGVLAPTAVPTLTLLTCYPFETVRPGGPLRYVVRAVAEGGHEVE